MNAIYMTNTNATDVLANNVVPFYVNKRAGGQCAFLYINNGVMIKKPGYYAVEGTITFTATDAGNATVSVQMNGQNVPGITATETITTADTEVRTIALHGFVKVRPCDIDNVITLFNSGVAITTSNVSFSIIG